MFRLLGFPVQIRSGFVIFLGLIVFINGGGPLGVYLALAIAVFTLLHEFGHAVAARSAGAEAAISLDFMAGYTSFQPRKPLTRPQRAGISIAGPATQIVTSLAVLAAMGVNPVSIDSVRESEASIAIWWAGPVIGMLNLVPVLPLDGGHLAQTGLEAILRRPALREMAIASLVLTIGIAVAMAVSGRSGFVLFVAFLVLGQIQILQATSKQRATVIRSEPSIAQSPWTRAGAAIAAGQPDLARRLLLDDLVTPRPPGWAGWGPPRHLDDEQLAAIVATLPADPPSGNAWSEGILAQVLYKIGERHRAGTYAAACFEQHRAPLLALVVARAAAAAGDRANAVAWVGAVADAAQTAPPDWRLDIANSVDDCDEFDSMRNDPEFVAARRAIA